MVTSKLLVLDDGQENKNVHVQEKHALDLLYYASKILKMYRSGCLSLDIIDTLGWINLCCGGLACEFQGV